MRQNAFAGKTELSEEEIEQIADISRYGRDNPIYHAETDLCVVARDGTHVSGCEALIDTRNLEADIERVCTHSNYRRQGLARVVIQECLYRLKEMGMKKAHITGYSEGAIALYGSLGSRERTEFFIYNQEMKLVCGPTQAVADQGFAPRGSGVKMKLKSWFTIVLLHRRQVNNSLGGLLA